MPATSHLAIDSLPLAFGIIMAIIGLVFYTQGLPGKFWQRFYAVLPGIVLCCFIPATLNSLGVFADGWLTDLWFYRHVSVASKFAADDFINGCAQDIGLRLESHCHVLRRQYCYYY